MAKWQEEAQTLAAGFYPAVRDAFAFLGTKYGYQLVEEKLNWPEDYRDTTAEVTFASEQMEVGVYWYFSSGIVGVSFQKLQAPRRSPEDTGESERPARLPIHADLYSLARYLGTAQEDPDFLLGDTWNVYESKCKKRDALIKSNLRGVLDGLARATERYASDILTGDTGQFAAVKEYHKAHQYDYWRSKKR